MQSGHPESVAREASRGPSLASLQRDAWRTQRAISRMRLAIATNRYAIQTGREAIEIGRTLLRALDGCA